MNTSATQYKPYPAYKASGVDWLESVPEHWGIVGLRHACRFEYGDSLSGENRSEGDVGVYGSNGLVGWHDAANTLAPVVVVGRKGSFGKLNFSEQPVFAIDTTYYIDERYTPNELQWLRYALVPLRLDSSSKDSAVPGLSREDAYQNKLPVPPPREQRAIAEFLDRETGRIDALIAKKLRLIELLEEKRTALISHTVTKGLNPDAPMKPSGIEWLGEIPAHWEVKPLKHVTELVNGAAFKPSDWSKKGTPIIRIENLNGGNSFNYFAGSMPSKCHVTKGDLLFGWSGNRGTSFGPFIWWRDGLHYLNQHIFRLMGFACNRKWFYYSLKAVTWYIEFEAHGIIGMVHVTKNKLGSIPLGLPPLAEQRAIADHLDHTTGRIDTLISKNRELIDKLQERRSALISAAVTGKIDVRGET